MERNKKEHTLYFLLIKGTSIVLTYLTVCAAGRY